MCDSCRNLDLEGPELSSNGQYQWVWESDTECQICQFIHDSATSIHPDLAGTEGLGAYVRLDSRQNRFYFDFFSRFVLQVYVKLDYEPEADYDQAGLATESPIDFTIRCLEECEENHDECSQPTSDLQPTRLIYCAQHADQLQLVESTDVGDVEYIALSYCWGSEGLFKTTQDNVDELKEGFDLDALPQTLRDAVEVTRQLGMEYIWIDAICIIQDNPADWEREAGRMAEVYGNARVTLAALSASTVTEGFLHLKRSPAVMTQELIDGYGGTSLLVAKEGVRTGLHPQRLDRDSPWPAVGGFDHYLDPVQTRGWCFQEEVLSRRFIGYSSREVQWMCKSSMGCQCGPRDPDSGTSLRPRPQTLTMHDDPFGFWAEMISSYSRRALTYQKDKLPAISGLARLVQQATSADYIAGVWVQDLARSLNWVARNVKDVWACPSTYRAPSFSWASLDSPVSMSTGDYLRGLVEVLDWHVEPRGQDPLGEIDAASLTVRGFVHSATLVDSDGTQEGFGYDVRIGSSARIARRYAMVRHDTELVRFQTEDSDGQQEQWSIRRAKEGEMPGEDDPRPEVTVLALCLGVDDEMGAAEFLILGQCPTDPDTWERIGSAKVTANDPQPDSEEEELEFNFDEFLNEITDEAYKTIITLV
ncbi:heterokaryon incompatibility protein-domain-containing protein [Cercophora samala]|uniref:Heterokaryon incompatibility protein-domain-containing protein n=1 Tax=Cercophora samala TaxID=330535 RepID=A0AA40DF93_9PEZI|nr:heterokaryon incompatibility protein-domain-containing protein [Cercophora samala]